MPETLATEPCDVAVVGGGAAGLHVALEAAEAGGRVVVVSRKPLQESASFRAQGGLAAAISPDDSPARHAEDTFNAGRGPLRPRRRRGARDGVARRRRGAEPARRPLRPRSRRDLALGLEGGHSARRIVHAGGAETGRALTSRLAELVAAENRIEVLEGASALSLCAGDDRCEGVMTDRGPVRGGGHGRSPPAAARRCGAGRRTRKGAIGAGAVLAHAAGAELADLELCQFHPTALALPGAELDGWLITEAVRGEGAILLDAAGRRFTDELAPRDQVSAAILDRMAADGLDSVGLDLRPVPLERFPTIVAALERAGLDPAAGPGPGLRRPPTT